LVAIGIGIGIGIGIAPHRLEGMSFIHFFLYLIFFEYKPYIIIYFELLLTYGEFGMQIKALLIASTGISFISHPVKPVVTDTPQEVLAKHRHNREA
jgi:hypothetical protein